MSATKTAYAPGTSCEENPHVQPDPRRRLKRSRKAAQAPQGFQFISSDKTGKPTDDTRQFIRSHVMRGKNRKKRLERFPRASDSQEGSTPPEPSPDDATWAGASQGPRIHGNRMAFQNKDGEFDQIALSGSSLPPACMPSDLQLMKFPEVMDDKMRGSIFRFFTAIKETMYPVEWCFRPDVNANCWFQWLFQDTAYFFSVLFVASSFQDIYAATRRPATLGPGTDLSRRLSPRTTYYLRRTIGLLQKRLEDPSLSVEDVSIGIVVSLAMVADACGDIDGARAHVSGLKQMVRMRGGVKGMMSSRHVLAKICRVDLSYSIKYGEDPEFYDDQMSWTPLIDRIIELKSPVGPEAAGTDLHNFITIGIDGKLQNVFCDLRAFSNVASRLATSNNKLRPELFQEVMMSIQYRLLLLKYDMSTISEALRIGLLAYQTSVFLQIHGTKMKYDFIANQLTTAIRNFPETTSVLLQLKLWFVFIGSIAVLDSEEPWLLSLVRRLTLGLSWKETKERLGDIMWISPIHDVAGKQVYEGARVVKDTVTMGLQRFWTEFMGLEGL